MRILIGNAFGSDRRHVVDAATVDVNGFGNWQITAVNGDKFEIHIYSKVDSDIAMDQLLSKGYVDMSGYSAFKR